MSTTTLRDKAERFRALHRGGRILVLPNAWDVATARVFAAAGFPAVATTSAGIAFSLGYPDGERVPRDEMLAVVARIARAVPVPVTADVEAGYGQGPEATAETVRAVVAAGAVGVNLEDGTGDPARPLVGAAHHADRVRAARGAAAATGVPVVVNARTDVFLAGVGPPEGRLEEALARGRAFEAAGADCVFVPGVTDEAVIGSLVRGLGGPLNVLAAAGSPPVPVLERLGVARVSVGSGPMRAALGLCREIARELLGSGTYEAFTRIAIPYAEADRLLEGER